MKTKKQYIVSIIAFLLLIVNVGILFRSISLRGFYFFSIPECAVELALTVTACIYVLNSFSKKSAINYKLYFIISAAAYVIEYFFSAFDPEAANDSHQILIGVSIEFICFGAYVLLAFAPDFGKRNSLIAVYIPLIMYVLCIAYYVISYLCGFTSGDSFLYHIWAYISYIPSCLLEIIFVYEKYLDKASRKSEVADK